MIEMKVLLDELNIEDPRAKAALLQQYMELVLERNQHVNLTAVTDPAEFIEKHYVDSLAAARLPEFQKAQTVIDVGTGGGFPGVPLAICFPEKEFVLADSLNKRIRIIQEFCEKLGIGNVTAIHGRAEELGRQKGLRDAFDICVSRAVADLRVLAEYCLPFVNEGGAFIAYKSAGCEDEIAGAKHAIKMLGARIDRIEQAGARDRAELFSEERDGPEVPLGARDGAEEGRGVSEKAEDSPAHQLIVIRKLAPTPAAYPRRAGVPAKKPL